MEFYILIMFLIFIINSTDKILSVNLCEKNEKLWPTFAEIFGQEWENEKMEENETETDQNENHRQIDQNALNSADSIRNDQQNDQFSDEHKYKIIHKFHAMKEGIKNKGKYSHKIWNKINQKIAEKLGISRKKIYKWKKDLKIKKSKKKDKNYYEMKKNEFIERIDEIKRMSKKGKQKQFAKELGISKETFRKWKKEFGIEIGKNANVYSNEEKTDKMNIYYKMKNENPSLTDKKIAGHLKISIDSLIRWKKTN